MMKNVDLVVSCQIYLSGWYLMALSEYDMSMAIWTVWDMYGATAKAASDYSANKFCDTMDIRLFHYRFREHVHALKLGDNVAEAYKYGSILRKRLVLCVLYRLIAALRFQNFEVKHAQTLTEFFHLATDVNTWMFHLNPYDTELLPVNNFLIAVSYFLVVTVEESYFPYWGKLQFEKWTDEEKALSHHYMNYKKKEAPVYAKYVSNLASPITMGGRGYAPVWGQNKNLGPKYTPENGRLPWMYRNQKVAEFANLKARNKNTYRWQLLTWYLAHSGKEPSQAYTNNKKARQQRLGHP